MWEQGAYRRLDIEEHSVFCRNNENKSCGLIHKGYKGEGAEKIKTGKQGEL